MKEGWEYKKLGEVAEIIGGSTPKTDIPEYWDGDNYWVTPAELDGSKYIEKTQRTITQKAIEKTNLSLLPIGTVLLSSRAPIGKLSITKSPMYCNQGFKNIVCGESLYNEFVYYYLKNNVDYLQSLGTGATFKEISKKVVEKIEMPVPSITEQQQIVSELDLLSGVIEKQKAQLEELDKLAQSIFYVMFGDPVTNEKGWKTDELAKVAPQKGSENKVPDSNGNYWVLNLDMICSNTGEIINKVYFGENEIGNSTIIFDDGNVLYSKLRPYLNKVVLPDETGYGTSELVPLRPNKQFLNRIFLAYILRSKQFVEFISIKVQGAKMPRVSMNSLRGFHVILPPLSLQQEFAAKIEAIEAMKAKVRQSLKEAETLFNERMDYYFN